MTRTFSSAQKGIAGLFFVLTLSLGCVALPQKTLALGVGATLSFETNPALLGGVAATALATADEALLSKVLNGLAWAVAKAAIQSMTKSVVNWINGGFNGSPAFEQDLNRSLRRVGDTFAQSFLTQLGKEAAVHSPFIDDLVTNVGTTYYLYSGRDALKERLRYTLNQAAADDKAFLKGDFNQGGWDSWYEAFSNPANNPYGAQMIASQELAKGISASVEQRVQELSWGSGFLSWRGDCIKDKDGSDAVALAEIDDCQGYSVQTPGSVIEQTLIPNLNSPLHQLELADSINEIVGALAQQLVSQVIGGTGLRGVSQPSQGGGSSYLSRATDPSQYTSSAASSLSTGFVTSLSTSLKQVQQYRSNWVTLQDAANAAKNSCSSDSAKLADPIQTTLDAASVALPKADAAIAKLTELITRANTIASATSVDPADLSSLTADYQNYSTSSAYPTATEITLAATQSQESAAADTETLITTLTKLALPNCGLGVR